MSQSPLVVYRKISPNCTKPRRDRITHIVVHHMAGNCSIETCGEIFAPVARQASSHYGVGSDGRIGQYCYEENRAWTTSNAGIDHKAITIEVADDKYGSPWHTSDKAYMATVKLCADICKRNGIKKLVYTGDKQGNLHMHKWYANTDCPGRWWEQHFAQLAKDVSALLGPRTYLETYPSRKLPGKYPKKKGYFTLGDGYDKNVTYKAHIKRLQHYCNWMIGAGLKIDGHYGPATKSAVLRVQKALGMKGTHGNWGPGTQERAKAYKKEV